MADSVPLSPAEWTALAQACDTLIPSVPAPDDPYGFWTRSATALGVPALVMETLARTARPEEIAQFRRLLRLMASPLFGLVAAGRAQPFAELPADRREQALRWLADHPLPQLRQGFQALKRLTGFFYVAALDGAAQNPNWPALQYQSPGRATPAAPHPVAPLAIQADRVLDADAVVVGSGAGGGVAAAELARRGLSVVVLEAGPLPAPDELGGPELSGNQRLYLDQGTAATRDLGVMILAGACAGGGTTVNWTACIAPPPRLRAEWEREHGLAGLTGAGFASAVEDVMARLQVGLAYSEPPAGSTGARLLEGCRALGYSAGLLPRNAGGCGEDCGSCTFGCRRGAKLGTLRTYLADACAAGARLAVNCRAERVLIRQGRAAGVEARCGPHRVTVRAPRVIVAAGAIGTPALLLRSGLSSPHLGRHLRLHPTVAVSGLYADPVAPWSNRLLSAYSNEFVDPETGNGFLVEFAPAHPGLIAVGTPWEGGARYKEDLLQMRHTAPLIAVVRDQGEGRVTIGRDGRHRIAYVPAPPDRVQMRRGLQACTRIHAAAGAQAIFPAHARRLALLAEGGRIRPDALERYLALLGRLSTAPNRLAVFSAHQMGTARLGASPRSAVAGPDGQVFEVPGLYVCDGSAFPTAAGVNPMITIMSLALWIARQID